MTHHSWTRPLRAAALTALVSAMLGTAAFAQWPGPPPGGPGGPPFGGPMGRMHGPRQASVADTPLSALAAGLTLTADQKTKIAAIQTNLTTQRQALMPQRGDGPPDRDTMRAAMDKMRSLDQQAAADIKAVLTDTQKSALPALLKTLDDLRFVGIPAETYGDLKLTDDQKTKIAALVQTAQQAGRTAMDAARQSGDFSTVRQTLSTSHTQAVQQAMALLTTAQKAVVTAYKAAHPQPGPGGFGPPPGGFGPPPGGGGFGPPPGGGGFGPPPGGGGFGPPPGDGFGPPPPMDGPPPSDG